MMTPKLFHSDDKRCFKCNEVKPRSEFYCHPQMSDGLLGKCKDCARRDVRENRIKRSEHYSEYERRRAITEERRRRSKEYQQNHPDKIAQYTRRYRANNPEKVRAHSRVGDAKRRGELSPEPCRECGSTKSIHAHHEDYSRPLDVEWLCAACHAAEHRPTRQSQDARR